MESTRLGLWARPPVRIEGAEEEEADLTEVSLFDLLTFFKGAMDRYRDAHPPAMEIAHQKFSIKEKMEEMVGRIAAGGGRTPLSDVFRSLSGRAEAIAIFLAVLELLRLRVVRALQSGEFAEIYLESTGEAVSLGNYEEAYRKMSDKRSEAAVETAEAGDTTPPETVRPLVEALLFASSKPVSPEKMAEAAELPVEEVEAALAEIEKDCQMQGRGVEMIVIFDRDQNGGRARRNA
jgi:hypothetical protein